MADRDLAPDRGLVLLLAAIAVLVIVPLSLVALLGGETRHAPPTPLQASLDARLPVVGARGGTSYVIRSVSVSDHSGARWYLEVGGSAKGRGAGYVGDVDGLVAGSPCGGGRPAEVVRTTLSPRPGDEGYGTADLDAVASVMAQAATRLVADACATLPGGGEVSGRLP